jgi:hypothetical protein
MESWELDCTTRSEENAGWNFAARCEDRCDEGDGSEARRCGTMNWTDKQLQVNVPKTRRTYCEHDGGFYGRSRTTR